MRRHEPLDVDAAVIRLARQVDRLQHDVSSLVSGQAGVRLDVDAHSRSLGDLADLLRRLRTDRPAGGEGAEAGEEPAPEWLSVTDPGRAVAWLSALDRWTWDVWRHFHPLVTCWPWHPGVVAELLTCQLLWSEALSPDAGPGALGAWHDRWRPGTAHRVTRALTACERSDGLHVTGANGRWSFDPAALDEVAVWWATTHGAFTGAPGLAKETR